MVDGRIRQGSYVKEFDTHEFDISYVHICTHPPWHKQLMTLPSPSHMILMTLPYTWYHVWPSNSRSDTTFITLLLSLSHSLYCVKWAISVVCGKMAKLKSDLLKTYFMKYVGIVSLPEHTTEGAHLSALWTHTTDIALQISIYHTRGMPT